MFRHKVSKCEPLYKVVSPEHSGENVLCTDTDTETEFISPLRLGSRVTVLNNKLR